MEILSQVFLPLSLAIIMFGMGMTLVPLDFSRIVKFPKAVFLGLFNQLILLPLVGFGLVMLFDLEPIMAIGVMVLAACPGGVTSNLITQICKGNIA
ncbi:MAG: BASS family bile acid:Na+ symporter, partial [Sphingobacteriales bacterium]